MEADVASVAIETLNYVVENFSDDFVIHVEHSTQLESGLEIMHFVFGCVDWSCYNCTRWHSQNKFFPHAPVIAAVEVISQSELHDYTRIILLSNDLVYGFSFNVSNGFPQAKIDLSSAIFGKGTFYDYLKIVLKNKVWQMYSPFPRGVVYNRQRGTLRECLSLFRETEQKMEHPYQLVIQQFPSVYRDATKCKRRFL